MAMMMTGRVLLVCALCVLWCSSVVQAADGFISDGSDEIGEMVLTWHNEFNRTCNEQSTKEGILDESAFKSCMRVRMKEVCGSDDDGMSSTSHEPEAEEICKKYAGNTEEHVESSTPLTEPSHDAETQVATPNSETLKGGAAEMESTPGAPAGDSPANPTEGPKSTSPATDTANSEAEKDGKEVMPKNAPESNATRKGEGEEKHSNTKETTVDADAMQNNTTAENDGSTAVSHTTSPLLPLLVACAAAAAVVAA
ncbi:Mucin-associated surface protein (MASP) [Trypanosoma cruzi]|uniref:Mucin-associated surface protein (MASP), putative n=2 Tax=Trypanosoma cruzi TaxID=5693 RepID=Q4E049_TRYCC|nr:mucin-associated surface protein (MASP), putative [Trypanosoma cruzi]EAN98140.1 mucin-associated surface protein (MASP), putative [Trypanosoma cruzi]PWV19850.1 Mucin-associated surface protein (MASP) [Trypanosoma cruzi]|eukprot:XP_819991.1 mucin-associated surface protein (MASP) [Trypanosoma cruzi strain CL Brener]